jgi:DNA-binding winged helix-turn-helix (wHTH) protein
MWPRVHRERLAEVGWGRTEWGDRVVASNALNSPFRIGDVEVRPAEGALVRPDAVVHLEPRVTDVLVYLARHAGRVLHKHEILDAVWPDRYVSQSVLTRAIAILRRELGDDAGDPTFIETIPKRGYRLLPPVVWEHEPVEDVRQQIVGQSGRFWLMVDRQEVPLTDGPHVIGRGVDATIRVASSKASRRHARLVVQDDDLTIEDLGSKNGTRVSGDPLEGRRRLRNGDQITIGSTTLLVCDRAVCSTASGTRDATEPSAVGDAVPASCERK